MSAPAFDVEVMDDDGWPSAELDELQAAIVGRLRDAGVSLPDDAVSALAEEVLADAVRLSVAWMERR